MLMPAVSCPHQDADTTRRVCFHLLETKDADYYWQFTGVGMEYDLVCLACREHADQLEANLREVCLECFEEIREEGCWDGIIGRPQIRERPTNLSFSHQVIALSEPISDRILDIQPIEALARSVWVALTETGALLWIDLADCAARALAQLPASEVQLKEPVSLHLSMDGHLAAVVNAYGQHGIVLHLHTGLATMPLKRDTYYIGISEFPIAFCELEGRTLLIHGTKWNRLDISDPRTGALLTRRVFPPYERGKSIPEHYLDYFHCSLSISPSQEWIADNGWIWSPVGSVESWSLRRWLQENTWESEDGPSKKTLCRRDYYWNGPLCWIDGQTLAVWGYGKDEEWLIPAVRVFDVPSGNELRWFPGPLDEPHQTEKAPYQEAQAGYLRAGQAGYLRAGPRGFLAFDTYLFACSEARGTSVWDIAAGERLLHDAALCPVRYHRGARQFLSVLPDGAFQISQLIGQP